jgi:hypothetical protein
MITFTESEATILLNLIEQNILKFKWTISCIDCYLQGLCEEKKYDNYQTYLEATKAFSKNLSGSPQIYENVDFQPVCISIRIFDTEKYKLYSEFIESKFSFKIKNKKKELKSKLRITDIDTVMNFKKINLLNKTLFSYL